MSEGQRTVSFRCSALIDALIDVEDVFIQVGKSEGFLLAYFKNIFKVPDALKISAVVPSEVLLALHQHSHGLSPQGMH